MRRTLWTLFVVCLGCGADPMGQVPQGTDRSVNPGIPPVTEPSFTRDNPCVDDAPAAVDALEREGAPLAVWSGPSSTEGVMSWPRYTGTAENGFGLNNHVQSIVRLRAAPTVVVSGSNVADGIGELFVAELPSRTGQDRWGSNLAAGEPAPDDALALRIAVDADLWHAGGMSTLGNLLAVGIEGNGSVVDFYDVTDPMEPVRLDVRIERDQGSAAVALARLEDDRIVAIVRDGTTLDFYLSKSGDIEDGFETGFERWDNDGPGFDGINNLQNHHLLQQCDGRLFLLTANNSALVAPTFPGDDDVYLFEVLNVAGTPDLVPVLSKNLSCDGGSNCNFDAGSSAYVTDDRELLYYGVRHFRDVESSDTLLRMAEFAAAQ